jgi:hypothetical protein
VDVYRTDFENQTVVDWDASARQIRISNLDGQSFANSAQVQVDYELVSKLDVRLAWRYYDVRTQYQTGLLQRALVAQHRAFANVAFEGLWKLKWDATVSVFGPKRLPSTVDNPVGLQRAGQSPIFATLNAQVSRKLVGEWDVYLGGENLLDFRQQDLIVDPTQPFGAYFDSGMVWGPIIGRMIYIGFRYRVTGRS